VSDYKGDSAAPLSTAAQVPAYVKERGRHVVDGFTPFTQAQPSLCCARVCGAAANDACATANQGPFSAAWQKPTPAAVAAPYISCGSFMQGSLEVRGCAQNSCGNPLIPKLPCTKLVVLLGFRVLVEQHALRYVHQSLLAQPHSWSSPVCTVCKHTTICMAGGVQAHEVPHCHTHLWLAGVWRVNTPRIAHSFIGSFIHTNIHMLWHCREALQQVSARQLRLMFLMTP
jgi:hypothetical protein